MVRRRVRNVRKRNRTSNSGYIYLGKRVRDREPKGLSHLTEAKEIAYSIFTDYDTGKINKVTFNRRTAILSLAVVRDSDLSEKDKAKALAYINFIRVSRNLRPIQLKRGYDKETYKKEFKRLIDKVNQKLKEYYLKQLR